MNILTNFGSWNNFKAEFFSGLIMVNLIINIWFIVNFGNISSLVISIFWSILIFIFLWDYFLIKTVEVIENDF